MDQFTPEDIEENMDAFAAATLAREFVPTPHHPQQALVVLDGSNQDVSVLGFAGELGRRFGTGLVVMRTGRRQGQPATTAGGEGIAMREVPGGANTGNPADRIASTWEREHCDLAVIAAPHGENFEDLGDASIGSTLDLLLARRDVPIFVVREPRADPSLDFKCLMVPLNLPGEVQSRALSWAFGMVAPAGSVKLLTVADVEVLRAARKITGSDAASGTRSERTLAGLLDSEMASLAAGAQRMAAERHLQCRLDTRTGQPVETVAGWANELRGILVTSCPGCGTDMGSQRVLALLRVSRNPVLIV